MNARVLASIDSFYLMFLYYLDPFRRSHSNATAIATIVPPRSLTVVEGASHVVMISHSEAVAKVIEDAATAR
jgi:hypothetical protein